MTKVLMFAVAVVLAVAGCSSEQADPVACKTAMSSSSTGPAVWTVDKNSRPAECKGMKDEAFNKLATEWYDEQMKKMGQP